MRRPEEAYWSKRTAHLKALRWTGKRCTTNSRSRLNTPSWFITARQALDAFVEATQRNVSGSVRLKLLKGRCTPAGVTSSKSLYAKDLASFTMGAEYDQADAKGFIRLFGLPLKVAALAEKKKRR